VLWLRLPCHTLDSRLETSVAYLLTAAANVRYAPVARNEKGRAKRPGLVSPPGRPLQLFPLNRARLHDCKPDVEPIP
jgi:hypothetical protein